MILPDYLRSGLRLVFCGTAAGPTSSARHHYYAGAGNEFWAFLHGAGITGVRLRPEDDESVLDFGIGLTDLAKNVAASADRGLRPHYDTDEFCRTIELHAPVWVAFHGKEAAKEVSAALHHGRKVRLGRQPWAISSSSVFVVPNASGSNRDPNRLEGRTSRLEWFEELAAVLPAPR